MFLVAAQGAPRGRRVQDRLREEGSFAWEQDLMDR